MNPLLLVAAVVLSYLAGSVPTGYWLCLAAKRVDIRKSGSGNTGATNAWRVCGPALGVPTGLIDIAKGYLAVVLISRLAGAEAATGEWVRVTCGLVSIAGHNWSCFLGFRAGKGVLTSLGVFLALAPAAVGLAAAVWLVCALATAYVSLSSMVAALTLPLWVVLVGDGVAVLVFACLAALLVVVRHAGNVRRLFSGTESRIPWPWRRRPPATNG